MSNKPFSTFLFSSVILCFGYFVIRYILFDFHGMKQWPLVLLVGCVVVIVVSCLAHSKVLPLVTTISYSLGFVVGELFHTTTFDDAVGRTDNLWMIWTAVIMAAIIVSGIVEFIKSKNTVKSQFIEENGETYKVSPFLLIDVRRCSKEVPRHSTMFHRCSKMCRYACFLCRSQYLFIPDGLDSGRLVKRPYNV